MAEQESGPDEAQRILEDGLKTLPSSIPLYLALAKHEFETGQAAKAIKLLEAGVEATRVKSIPGAGNLHRMLAGILAGQQDNDKLRARSRSWKELAIPIAIWNILKLVIISITMTLLKPVRNWSRSRGKRTCRLNSRRRSTHCWRSVITIWAIWRWRKTPIAGS